MKISTLFRTAVLLTALIGTALTAHSATAYDFFVDGIYYKINSDGKTASVTYQYSPVNGTANSNAYYGDVIIPEKVSYGGTTYTVTAIGSYAFRVCWGLSSVVIPSTVTTIENNAFENSNIISVTIPNSVTSIGEKAFYITRLTSVSIPSSVMSIGNAAFQRCSSLTTLNFNAVSCADFYAEYLEDLPFDYSCISTINIGSDVQRIPAYFACGFTKLTDITIPTSVTSIGIYAFKDCTGLNGVYISDISAWLRISFMNAYGNPLSSAHHLFLNNMEIKNLVIPNDITYIPFAAFYGCSGLTSVTIPNSVYAIVKSAFVGCSGLTKATIPNSVTSIGSYAFYQCTNLTEATIPNTISSIEEYTFYNCEKLEDINLTNVQNVGNYAFYGCTGVKNMIIGKSLSWGENAFNGCAPTKLVWNAIKNGHIGIITSNISQLTIGAEVEILPNYFVNGSQITSVTIPNSVTSIGVNAFSDCTSLTRATIGNSVNSIGPYAFNECSSLSNITIPNSVKTIGDGAFSGCTSLTRATIGNSVSWIGSSAFDGCTKLSNIIIPNSVKTIGEQAFYGCSNMTSATIGNSVNTLEYRTFYGCSDLNKLIIGNSVITIKESVFGDCKNLTQVYCRANMPPMYEANHDRYPLFEDIVYQNAVLYVPDVTYGYYLQAEPWKRFMEIKTESYSDDDVQFSTSVYPTSIRMEVVNITGTQQANAYFTFEGVKYNPFVVTGLEPKHLYNATYTKNSIEIPLKFYTSELKMIAEGAMMLDEKTALLKAETNMADEETICGFDWRRYEGPDDYLGTRVYCPVYGGTMAGTLKNLAKDTYYKYRPVYKSKANNVYYGDWVTFYTGDVGVEFDPVVYTYNSPEVTQTSAVLQGVALRGSDEITEQGFEYWRKNGIVSKVTATGERMSASVTGLQAGSAYTFRAYLKAGGKTAYGEEVNFTTISVGYDVNGDGEVGIADINVLIDMVLSNNYVANGDVNGDGEVNIADINVVIDAVLNQ